MSAPTLAALINSIAVDCTSVNFSDTTTNYGSGSNPTYQDVTHVKWELYDNTGSVLLGTFDTSGWTPYQSNAIELYASEFGVGATFANGTYLIKYTITYTDPSDGSTQIATCNTSTFIIQCGASLCNTTLHHIDLASMSGVTYPTTINHVKLGGTTYTPSTPIAVSSLADVAAKLNTYIATLGSTPFDLTHYLVVVNGSTLEFQNPYYSGATADYSVTLNATPYAGTTHTTTNVQVPQNMAFDYNCDTKVLKLTDTSGIWTGTSFPQIGDIDGVDVLLYQVGNGTPLETKTLTATQYGDYVTNGVNYSDWFTTVLIPCTEYNIVPQIALLNGDTLDCHNGFFKISYCGALKQSGLVVKMNTDVTSDCTKLAVCDVTGQYNATSNPMGYGIPNPTYEDIVRTEFTIGLPDGTTKVFDTGFTPSEYGDNCFAFTLTDLFGSDTTLITIPDYVYPITYKVFAACDQLLGSYSFNAFYACNLKACLDARSQETSGCTNCDNDEIQSILLGYADYMRMSAVAVTQPQCAANQLSQAYKQCITKCSTCP